MCYHKAWESCIYGHFLNKESVIAINVTANYNFKLFKNFMAPFYGWGSTISRLEPLRRRSLTVRSYELKQNQPD